MCNMIRRTDPQDHVSEYSPNENSENATILLRSPKKMCEKNNQMNYSLYLQKTRNQQNRLAYVNRKRTKKWTDADREQNGRINWTEPNAIYLVQLKIISATPLQVPRHLFSQRNPFPLFPLKTEDQRVGSPEDQRVGSPDHKTNPIPPRIRATARILYFDRFWFRFW